MRILRVAGVLIALAAALVAGPAHADEGGLSLRLVVGWDGAAAAGGWVPYQVSVSDNSATRDFSGTLVIRPVSPAGAGPPGTPATYGTTYEQAFSVHHASQKAVTIFGDYIDGSTGAAGFVAELEDPTGAVVARSPVAALNAGRFAIGLLSDSLQAAGQIKDVPIKGTSLGVVQLSPQTFPADALLLSGLTAIVIDDFDTSSLSQAQDQGLEQYVGLGGQLVLVGGSSWRRTLSQLPPALVPLPPQGTTATSLEPVLDLLARHSALAPQSVVGAVSAGARVVLADAAGHPLLAELNYGSGRVVEVAFDPTEEPIASHADEVRASWGVVLDRVTVVPTGQGRQGGSAVILAPSTTGLALPSRSDLDNALGALLNDTPANALPPLGILGGLLVAYILISGPINYVLLRSRRRRELMWITVPLIAVVFTAGSYAGGILIHGRDYFVNEIQLLRVAPSGAMDVISYDAVFSPNRGDVAIQLGGTSLASTYLPDPAGPAQGSHDRVAGGPHPSVNLQNLALWVPRDIKIENSARGPLAVEAHLRLAEGRIVGTVANHSRRTLHKLTLLTTDGRLTAVAAVLGPGATAKVDAALAGSRASSASVPGICTQTGCVDVAQAIGVSSKEVSAIYNAAGTMVSQAAQVQALAGLADGEPGFRIAGAVPNRSLLAAFALPVTLESVDSLPANWSAPRLVAGSGLTGSPVSVVDYELPRMPTSAQLKISAGNASPIGAPVLPGSKPQVEIYDWTASSWSAVDLSHAFQLSAGERGPDLVRLRVKGNLYLPGLQISGI